MRHKTKYPGVYYREAPRIGGPGTEKVFYVVWKKEGRTIEAKVGRQHAEGMTPARAARKRGEFIEGKDQPASQKRKTVVWTVAALWDAFEEAKKGEIKSFRDDRFRYRKHLEPVIGKKLVDDLTTFDVERVKRKMNDRAPATVKHVVVLLKRMTRFGAERGLIKMPDSFKLAFKMPTVNNEQTDDLTTEQMQRLLEVLDGHENNQVANLMKLALYTGMRRGELFRLQWEHIDLEKGFIRLVDTKGGKDMSIPVNDAARALLESHERTSSPHVFPGKNGGKRTDCKRAVASITKDAGLPEGFRPLHGLRHTFASMLASSGQVDMYTLQKLLTHKSASMTQRYAHLRDEAMQRAAGVASDLFRKAEGE